jgi:protein-S-isoprenylcysteine O-methyltransferase Ste14
MNALPNFVYIRAGALIWAAWLVSWTLAAFWTRRTATGAPNASFRRQLATAGAGFAFLFGEPMAIWRPLWFVPAWLGWALVGAIAVGMAFAWWARLHLGALWSGGVETREGHRIVDSGPYGLVRHPIYTGLILGAAALAGVKATPLSILGAGLIALGFGFKARVEERFLAAELGEADYAAYRAHVPMLVPFLPVRD